jgi:anti-sigma B factor antagonist
LPTYASLAESVTMPDDFEISNGPTRGKVVLLRVSGRLDTLSASQLLHRCAAVRNAGQDLVLNLSAVSFIASSGIGALLALAEEFREAEASVRLAALSPAVESVIKLLNLDQFLIIDASEDDALAASETRDAA